MFIKDAALLLDLEASSIDEIIHEMLQAVFNDGPQHNQGNHLSGYPSPVLSPRDSSTECPPMNNNNNNNISIHSRSHTYTRGSGTSLFASAAKQLSSAIQRREKLIEDAKKTLLLEIHHEKQTCGFTVSSAIHLKRTFRSNVRLKGSFSGKLCANACLEAAAAAARFPDSKCFSPLLKIHAYMFDGDRVGSGSECTGSSRVLLDSFLGVVRRLHNAVIPANQPGCAHLRDRA